MNTSPSSIAWSPPPRGPRVPFVGALPWLIRRRFEFFLEARVRYGDIYSLDLGPRRVIVVNHPDHAQHVLVDNQRNFTRGGPLYALLRGFLGDGMLVAEGDSWRRQRRMTQPHFHHHALDGLTGAMVEAVQDANVVLDEAADTSGILNASSASTFLAMSVLMKAIFGSHVGPEESARAAGSLRYLIDYVPRGLIASGLAPWMRGVGRRRFEESVAALDDVLQRVLARRGAGVSGSGGATQGRTLIEVLLGLVDAETGEKLSERELRDLTMTLFLAGFETTAKSLAWGLHLLSRHPHVAAKLREEVDAVVGDRPPRFEDLRGLVYNRMVVQEILRLYPTTYMLTRFVERDDEIGGFRVPGGSVLVVLIGAIQRHPGFWSDPDEFEPERFSAERSAGRHKLAWLLFGAGPHLCLGKDFTLMELQLILAMMTQRYDLAAVPGFSVEPIVSTTLQPSRDILVAIERRRKQ